MQNFLQFMGAHSFDPYNVHLINSIRRFQQRLVFIHKKDLGEVHHIPNLLVLKHPASHITFVTYGEVWDVKYRMYEEEVPIMDRGGVLVLDDVAIMSVATCEWVSNCACILVQAVNRLLIISLVTVGYVGGSHGMV